MRAQIGILVLSLTLTSCLSVLPKPGPEPDIFRLGEISLPEHLADTPVVMVELPRTPKALRNNRLAILQGGQGLAYTSGARWAAPVPQIMGELLGDALLATGRINVVTPEEGVHPRYVLITEIRHFEIVYDNGDEAAPLGRVTVRAKIIDRNKRAVLAQHHFEASIRARENRLAPIAAAVDEAAQQTGRELGSWVAGTLDMPR
jgi:cholesterol transport system auxiliary component